MKSRDISRLVHLLAEMEGDSDSCDLALIEQMAEVLAEYWDETPEQVSVMVIEVCAEFLKDTRCRIHMSASLSPEYQASDRQPAMAAD